MATLLIALRSVSPALATQEWKVIESLDLAPARKSRYNVLMSSSKVQVMGPRKRHNR